MRHRSRESRWTSAFAALVVTLAAGSSFAEDVTQQAHAAFDRGNEAHERHDYAAAAREFARADELAPNDDALSAALDEATLTDDAVFAMRLVQRARGRAGAAAAAEKARAKFADKIGYVKVSCACSVDGEPLQPGEVAIVAPGLHRVGGSRGWSVQVEVKPGATVEPSQPPPSLPPRPAPPPQPPPDSRSRPGASPWWVVAGSIATVGLGAGTLGSFIDTKSKHDAFVAQQCSTSYAAPCSGLASDGRTADVRTGVLFGVTLGVAVATTLVAVLGVRWTWKPESVALIPGAVRIEW